MTIRGKSDSPPCIFCRQPLEGDTTSVHPPEKPAYGWHVRCYGREFGDAVADPLRLRVRDGVVEWAGR